MCGIAGILGRRGAPVDPALLRSMTRALAHRGPDGEGYHEPAGEGVGLGHRRLSIIDLESGSQPMTGEDGRVWVVFNGEIYNFQPLRDELAAKGHAFRTRSDTEVLVHGYEEWGDAVLERIRGMFALCIWDGRARRALLARDRMGKKPLYWAAIKGGLVFASELKALLLHPEVDDALDEAALGRYLIHEYVPAPRTIVRGARKLGPGECLVFEPDGDGAGPRSRRYHDLAFPAPGAHRPIDMHAAAEELVRRLRGAVRRRLVADVPLGVFLSGGIDSSTVVALMAQEVPASSIKTFAVGFSDRSFDESDQARRVARAFGTDHREEQLEPETLLSVLPDVVRLLDEPLGDASIVPTYLLARFTRRHVTVALGGDGGDELFAGYPTFQADRAARAVYDRAPGVAGRLLGAIAERLPVSTANLSHDFKLRQFLRGAPLPGVLRHQAWLGSFLPAELGALLDADLARGALVDDPFVEIDARVRSSGARDPADALMYFYCRYYLEGDILVKVDRATMGASLEARAPFLDEEVVAFAAEIAPSLRMRGLTTKAVLKHAMRGALPDEVLRRPKKGFGIPVARWLKDPLRPMLLDHLGAGAVRRAGLFRPARIEALVQEHLEGRRDNRKQLWTLLMLELWRAHHGRARTAAARAVA